MPGFAQAFKDEIRRLARKEVKAEIAASLKEDVERIMVSATALLELVAVCVIVSVGMRGTPEFARSTARTGAGTKRDLRTGWSRRSPLFQRYPWTLRSILRLMFALTTT